LPVFSILRSLSLGFISDPILKALQGKAHEVHKGTWVIAAIFIAPYVFMTLRFGSA
jgi:adenine/guanine/hypoxanthine permease